MTEKEKLLDRLFNDPKTTLLNFHIVRGSTPGAIDEEDLCREINSAMDQVESGRAMVFDHPPETELEKVSIKELCANR